MPSSSSGAYDKGSSLRNISIDCACLPEKIECKSANDAICVVISQRRPA